MEDYTLLLESCKITYSTMIGSYNTIGSLACTSTYMAGSSDCKSTYIIGSLDYKRSVEI